MYLFSVCCMMVHKHVKNYEIFFVKPDAMLSNLRCRIVDFCDNGPVVMSSMPSKTIIQDDDDVDWKDQHGMTAMIRLRFTY